MSATIDGRWKIFCNTAVESETPSILGADYGHSRARILLYAQKSLEIDDHFQKPTKTARLENAKTGYFHARYPHLRPENASGCTCAPRSFSGETPLFCLAISGFRAKNSAPIFEISAMVTGVAGVAGLWNVCDDRRTMDTILQHGYGVRNPLYFGPDYGRLPGRIPLYAQKSLEIDDHFQTTTNIECPGFVLLVAIMC